MRRSSRCAQRRRRTGRREHDDDGSRRVGRPGRCSGSGRAQRYHRGQRGRIVVDDLPFGVHPDVYAVGDSAAAHHPDGSPLRMACATALPLGRYAGDVIAARAHGRSPRPLRFRYFFQCLSLGRDDGVIQFVDAHDRPRERVLTDTSPPGSRRRWCGARRSQHVVQALPAWGSRGGRNRRRSSGSPVVPTRVLVDTTGVDVPPPHRAPKPGVEPVCLLSAGDESGWSSTRSQLRSRLTADQLRPSPHPVLRLGRGECDVTADQGRQRRFLFEVWPVGQPSPTRPE